MLLKYISKTARSLGLFLIFSFAIFCIFGSLFMRDIDNDTIVAKFLEYTISFESRFYDYRMKNQINSNKKSKEVAIVTVDDYSLEKIGMWPIPRTIHADMIGKLKNFGAKVVALDILYPEKAPACGPSSPDATLANAFKNFQSGGGRVFLAYTTGTSKKDSLDSFHESMLDDSVLTQIFSEAQTHTYQIKKYTFPIDEFINSGAGLGSISMEEDPDGIFRQYLLLLNIDTIYFGSLGFNAWEAYTGKKHKVKISQDGSGELEVDGQRLEINNRGEAKIRFIGGLKHFDVISLYDLLEAKDNDPKMITALKNKIIFVGSTALGAHDLRASPIDSKMPGVLAHVNMVNMLLNKHFFKPINESVTYSLYLLFAGMLIFFLIQKMGNAFFDLLVIILILAISYAADYHYFLPQGYELKLFYCYFCFIACYSWNTFLKFSETSKEKNQIKGTFARYLAPTIVDEMLKNPEKLQVGGFKRDITCLFSDIRDFTSISEGLTAVELAHSLNLYMGKMTDIVFDTKGTLDKYIGDAIVAFWGAPLEIGNHAQFAVEGAIQMMNALPGINQELKKLGRPEFNMGIGLNSGECNVGNMGSARIFSYTALGDNMNLGARLESLCKRYGVGILISQYTLARLDTTTIKIRPIDKVIVKGKTASVAIFEVLHNWHPMTLDTESYNLYMMGWNLFQKRNFKAAIDIFNQILTDLESDVSTKRLRDLCETYLMNPELVDDDFDITKMTEK